MLHGSAASCRGYFAYIKSVLSSTALFISVCAGCCTSCLQAYDKLKFKRQEEAVAAAECGQINSRLANLGAEQQGLATLVDDLARRKVGGGVPTQSACSLFTSWPVFAECRYFG